MPQTKLMTLDEKLALAMKSIELRHSGKVKEGDELAKQIPVPSYMAKVMKEKFGVESLIGWNLSEAEAEFGTDWLDR